jgi:hypothetical protein
MIRDMTMLRKWAAGIAAAVMITVFGVATPAQAAFADCPNAYICIWELGSAGGIRWQWTGGYVYQQSDGGSDHCMTLPENAYNEGSSYYMRAGGGSYGWARFYNTYNCAGTWVQASVGQYGNFGTFNNMASSIWFP